MSNHERKWRMQRGLAFVRHGACVALLLVVAAAQAQQWTTTKHLLQTDPAAGFAAANEYFHQAQAAGDLKLMVALVGLCREPAANGMYTAVLDEMIDDALPLAVQTGDWQAIGDLYFARLTTVRGGLPYTAVRAEWLRIATALEGALAARQRAGKSTADIEGYTAIWNPRALAQQARDADRPLQLPALSAAQLRAVDDIESAVGEDRDADAVRLLGELLNSVPEDPQDRAAQEVAGYVGRLLWLRGTESLLPGVCRRAQDDVGELYRVFDGCVWAWSGRPDPYWDTIMWCWPRLALNSSYGNYGAFRFLFVKMQAFGRVADSNRLTQLLVDQTGPSYSAWIHGRGCLVDLLNPRMPPTLVEALLQEYIAAIAEMIRQRCLQCDMSSDHCWAFANRAPTVRGAKWWAEYAGREWAEAALGFPQTSDAVRVLSESQQLFAHAGRKDLAEGTRMLIVGLTAGDPATKLQYALAVARQEAGAGRWDNVVSGLSEATTGAPERLELVAALSLLATGLQRTGKMEAGEALIERAGTVLGRVQAAPGERAAEYLNLATTAQDPRRRLALLTAGQAVAQKSELSLLADSFGERVAAEAANAADPATARIALLQAINRLETRRDLLAFDPLLRQQWFADNLEPYRQLLRLTARTDEAPLALWVAEKMRARTLRDELAWQKVDLGVGLTAAERDQLQELREERERVYGLLAKATGSNAAADGLRGAYTPLLEATIEEPTTEAEVRSLRQSIEALAKREAAVASVIRESVPAYAAATETTVLSGKAMLEAVTQAGDLAVLHYTLTDTGLVLTACGPKGVPRVIALGAKPQALWDDIGLFREQIWERRPEVEAQARKLYDLLVLPAEGTLAGASRLLVIGDGALQLLPFSALRATDGTYLAQKLAVATTPALSLAFSPRSDSAVGAGAVVVAAPDTGPAAVRTVDAPVAMSALRGMYRPLAGARETVRGTGPLPALTMMAAIPLPGARAEGEAVAKELGHATLLEGKQATRDALWQVGPACGYLHIATHGYADPETPEFSGLLLAGREQQPYEVLTAQDVYLWRLKARLVTLSACQTGIGRTVEGEGLMGLTRAFLHAGARNVVCTLWPVADDSTQRLMVAFYANLKAGMPIEHALRQAQLSLLQSPETQAPFYWAGFALVRGPQ